MFTSEALEEIAAAVVQKLGPLLRAEGKPWPALMTLKVAHDYSGYSISKLKEYIALKQLATASNDSKGRVRKEDLDAFILRSRS